MPIKTKGLYHIHLAVKDMARSVRFYREAFGLEERFREGDELVFLGTPGRDDLITLNAEDGQVPVGSMGGVLHFGFLLEDPSELDAAVSQVVRAGGSLVRRGSHGQGKPFAYVADPDGYVIEL